MMLVKVDSSLFAMPVVDTGSWVSGVNIGG